MRKKEAFRDRMVYKDDVTYFDIAVEKYKPYKFVIAGENTNGLNGYVTEKLSMPCLQKQFPYIWEPQIYQASNYQGNCQFITDSNSLKLSVAGNIVK